MHKVVMVGLALALAGCTRNDNVYDETLPNRNDTQALLDIRDRLKPEDRQTWASVVMGMNNPMSTGFTSKTVEEVISRVKARTACMDEHSKAMDSLGDGPNDLSAPDYEAKNTAHTNAYNKEVNAYNACLKMPV